MPPPLTLTLPANEAAEVAISDHLAFEASESAPMTAAPLPPANSALSSPTLQPPTAIIPPTSTPTPLPTLDFTQPDFVSAEGLEALAFVNEWRVSLDLWPLALNEDLSALARGQAEYLASLDEWPDDLHTDALGGVSDDRARRAGWPGYDESGQAVAITEITSSGASPVDAVNWWRGSQIHTWVIEQAYYREAGVGTARTQFSTIFVIVVGSRPNVLPIMLDSVESKVYLTDERYSGGYNGIIGEASAVQFLPSLSTPPDPDGWLPWALTYPIDSRFPPVAVAFTDGSQMLVMSIDRVAWLPHSLPK
jgi:uncharacterized protein YkwD